MASVPAKTGKCRQGDRPAPEAVEAKVMSFAPAQPGHSLRRAAILGCPVNSLRSAIRNCIGESPFCCICSESTAKSRSVVEPLASSVAGHGGLDELQGAMRIGQFYG
jgi:hypothetical protein